ncbi:type VII secretion-associated serine protease mycosin [Micromonospora marina]|uniref:type VII secretion-associated serine protease mycosin n=1 Tax=Micromonospora marina TaxID=307120 RepID=UPI00345649C1
MLVGSVITGAAGPAAAAEPPGTATLTDVPLLDPTAGSVGCGPPGQVLYTGEPWAQARLAPHRVWSLTDGTSVTVAVVDSGVDASAPQLAGRVMRGTDVVGGGAGDDDCVGHGTFVAGLIAAAPQVGIAFAGVAPGARILPVRQTVDGRRGTADSLAAGIQAAVRAGATVVNVSVAAGSTSPALERAVQEALRRNVLVVAAVGNDGENGNARPYPASLPGVLAVGAIDQAGTAPGFSGSGAFVDLVAPGVEVVGPGRRTAGHLRASGTSFAAPFVSGVAALVRARHPGLNAAQVKHRLEVTADHPAGVMPHPTFGFGVVDAWAAVTAVLPEEHGATSPVRSPAVVAARPRPPESAHVVTAVVILAIAGVVAAGGTLVRVVLRAGRRRRRSTDGQGAIR